MSAQLPRPRPHRAPRRLGLLLTALALTAPVLAAAQQPRIGFRGDSLRQLTTGLSPAARQAVTRYLGSSDSASRSALSLLANDPTAVRFVLAAVAKEPKDSLRRSVIAGMGRRPHFAAHAGTIPALVGVVRRDPSPFVVNEALNVLRGITIQASGVRGALADRLSAAQAANDAAAIRRLLDADETFAHLEGGLHAPPFVREPGPPFAALPADRPIRILAFGDYGVAHLPGRAATTHQVPLAESMRVRHARAPFDFAITTGDNFYPTSFPTPDDPAWEISWENLYGPMQIPFYISLGNHDWYEPLGAGPTAQYVRGLISRWWRLPAYYYTYTAGPAQFFVINTQLLTPRQLTWLREALAASRARWKIVYGHFPVFEQTNYTTDPQQRLVLPLLQEFGVDLYLAGHHHTIQHWQLEGIDYVVTGAGGATNYSLGDTTVTRPGRRFIASLPAFAEVGVWRDSLTLRFTGLSERELYRYTRRK